MFVYICRYFKCMNDKLATRMIHIFPFSLIFFFIGCNEIEKPEKPITVNIVANKIDSNKTIVRDSFIPTAINYDTTKKYIYLSFDDGPQPGTTACVDVLKKLGIKATFFMVGQHASSQHLKQIVKDIKYSYPQILLANHSTTHASGKYKYFYHHEQMALQDFLQAQQTLSVPYKIIRLPGNTSWVRTGEVRASNLTKPVCKLLDSVGYNVMGWDVEWRFNRRTAYPIESAEKMVKIVANTFAENDVNQKNHLVILAHDRMFRNPSYTDSLTKFIYLLKENKNYVFETLDHYPNLKKLR